jgi:hypothetical protein
VNSREVPPILDPHQRYVELCALAAAGQLNGAEVAELNQHLAVCPECRESVRDFAYLCVQVLPACLAGADVGLPAGMTERFIARARSEGIQISDRAKGAIVPKSKESPPRNVWKTAFWAAVAASLFIGGILAWMVKQTREASSASVVAKRIQPSVGPGSPEKSSSGPEPIIKSGGARDIKSLEAQLRSTEARLATVTEQLKQRQPELDRLQKAPGNTASSPAVVAELRTLRDTVEQQKRELNNLRRLAAADRSATGLLTERNLHVIDVFPRDEYGNPTREFGRLFYVEGTTLEFYAFDLDDPDANRALYVWGESRDTANGKARIVPLGRLRFDSAQYNRWAFVLNDPKTLASLRFVFVTAERSERPPVEPIGKRMLFAPLDNRRD